MTNAAVVSSLRCGNRWGVLSVPEGNQALSHPAIFRTLGNAGRRVFYLQKYVRLTRAAGCRKRSLNLSKINSTPTLAERMSNWVVLHQDRRAGLSQAWVPIPLQGECAFSLVEVRATVLRRNEPLMHC